MDRVSNYTTHHSGHADDLHMVTVTQYDFPCLCLATLLVWWYSSLLAYMLH